LQRFAALVAGKITCSHHKIPCSAKIIPCSVEQGICIGRPITTPLFVVSRAAEAADFAEFPVLFPVSREFGTRDGFEIDCIRRQESFAEINRTSMQ
jgi:hypothetical protein